MYRPFPRKLYNVSTLLKLWQYSPFGHFCRSFQWVSSGRFFAAFIFPLQSSFFYSFYWAPPPYISSTPRRALLHVVWIQVINPYTVPGSVVYP